MANIELRYDTQILSSVYVKCHHDHELKIKGNHFLSLA